MRLPIEAYDLTVDESLSQHPSIEVVPLLDREAKVMRYGYWWKGVPPVISSGYPLAHWEAREALAAVG